MDAAYMEELFSVWDPNGTGKIKFDELARCLMILGKGEFSPEEVREVCLVWGLLSVWVSVGAFQARGQGGGE